MANELRLQNPLSSDRKPVKVNSDSTGLLLKDKDVIVEGNLEIEGSVTTDISASKNLTVDGDLTVNGAQYNTQYFYHADDEDTYLRFLGNRFIHVAGNTSIFDSNNEDFSIGSGKLYVDINGTGNVGVGVTDPDAQLEVLSTTTQLKLSYDANNYATLDVSSSGDFRLITTGAGTTDSDITLDADGAITLDPANGNFIAKNAGTEFSAANSAYAGMILGYTDIGLNEGRTTHNLTTSYTVPTDELSVEFVAPPSGNVEIFCQFGLFNAGSLAAGDFYAGLSTANATSGYSALQDYHEEKMIDGNGRNGQEVIHNTWTLTGLTAGTAYEYWVGVKSTSASGTPKIEWGGDDSDQYPSFIMKATALPASITT